MRARLGAVALTAAAIVPGIGACGTSSDPLTVAAASSLTDVIGQAAEAAPDQVRTTFTGTGAVVSQLRAGARIDVVGVADAAVLDQLVAEGLVQASPVVTARNRLAIAVAPGNPHRIETLSDLSSLVVVLADPAVPAGRYARAALDRAGVQLDPASLEPNVRVALGRVAAGEADAAIVYRSDIVAAAGRVSGVDIDTGVAGEDIEVAVGVAAGTARPEAAAAFVRSLVGLGAELGLEPFELEPFESEPFESGTPG